MGITSLGRERTHPHTRAQVNGNSCWHCHGKYLSQCPGSVPYGWMWLGREKVGNQWKHRNKDTVPKNMLQFGWPNVCSVCMSQIRNKFSNFMNNSTESNWSGHCNTQLKIDTQDRNPPPVEHELLHNGYYCTHNQCHQHCVITYPND